MHPESKAESDKQAERIVLEYGDSILRLCLMYLHDYHLAEDAAQDSLIKIHRKLPTFRGNCSEKTWIMRIVSNTCRDYYRSNWLRHTDRKAVVEELANVLPAPEMPDSAAADAVIDAVSRLPRALRETVLLRYYQNMRVAEVAQALHISVPAVNKRLKKAQEKLRPELWEVYFDA